jgi:hypothetical protein
MYETQLRILYRTEMSFKDTYKKKFSINREKSRLFVEYIKNSNLKDNIQIDNFTNLISYNDLKFWHTEEYLSDFFNADPRVEASIGIKLTPEYLQSAQFEVSALYEAIKYSLQNTEIISHALSCVFHHAWPTWWRMLCWLNGQVIASCKIYEEFLVSGVYIDLDHHYGNAIDESRWFNEIIDKAIPTYWNINPKGTHQIFLSDLKRKLNAIKKYFISWEIDYVVYCHWADSCDGDVFWGKLTEKEWLDCTKIVKKYLEEIWNELWKPIPLILALFGWYRENINEVLELHKKDLKIFIS